MATAVECSSCGEVAPDGATWCEACGHELGLEPKPACVSCGEREVDADEGYCLSCGYRQPRERDHLMVSDGPVVALSDRGRRHHHNEDSVAIGRIEGGADGQGETLIAVVCDGVSSTPGSAEASAVAAVAARDHLVATLTTSGAGAESDAVGEALREAVALAQEQASASPEPTGVVSADGPPSSTLVAVVARPEPSGSGVDLTTAWVGDSRAYWVGQDDARLLTGVDHELEGSLTRWLGSDSVDPTPDIESAAVTGPGHLVVCTDGLWRYAAQPGELAALVGRLTVDGRTGIELAEAMVGHANEQGGHDNITVALWSNRPEWAQERVVIEESAEQTSAPIAPAASTEEDRRGEVNR